MKNTSEKTSILYDYIVPCIIGILIGLFINQLFSLTRVKGLSMYPTLNNNDLLVMNKISKYKKDINHGDIIIFNATPFQDNKNKKVYYIKRVIGLPGDNVIITNGKVYLNNEELNEPYLKNVKTEGNVNITIPENSYFVLGDNRGGSADSRIFGVVNYDSVIGVSALRLLPLGKFKVN